LSTKARTSKPFSVHSEELNCLDDCPLIPFQSRWKPRDFSEAFLFLFFVVIIRFVNEIQSRLVRLGVQIFGGKKRLNFSFSQKKKIFTCARTKKERQRKKERERGREVIICKDNKETRRK